MKKLCMMNDRVKHPKAIPRTLYVFASMSSACSRSAKGLRLGAGETGQPTFTEDDSVGRRPSLSTSEKVEQQKHRGISHDEHSIHGVDACRQKLGVSVNVFKIILFPSVPG
jgi:hypothetical protein